MAQEPEPERPMRTDDIKAARDESAYWESAMALLKESME